MQRHQGASISEMSLVLSPFSWNRLLNPNAKPGAHTSCLARASPAPARLLGDYRTCLLTAE